MLADGIDFGMRRPSWQADAACRAHPNPAVFFPERGTSPEPARKVCAGCTVRDACLDFALEVGPTLVGIFGGMTARQRRAMRTARQHEVTAPRIISSKRDAPAA